MNTRNDCFRVSLIGNPNVGKTTLFNRLTGSAQYVGNWPGVTVEKKEGYIRNVDKFIKVTDLPGVYSLSPFSPEEIVTRNYILAKNSDLLVNIIDATNLERNLYLTTQILELGIPFVIALNMCDVLNRKGKVVDFCALEDLLGVKVIPISASKRIGLTELIDSIVNFEKNKNKNKVILKYNNDVESKILKIQKLLESKNIKLYNNRFVLIKILESDSLIMSSLKLKLDQINEIDKIRGDNNGIKYEELIASERYAKSSIVCKKVVSEVSKLKKTNISRKIDKIVTNKFLAFPIFALIIFIIFYISFGPVGSSFQELARLIISKGISNPLNTIFDQLHANEVIRGFFDSMVSGIGEVLAFMPQILLLLGLLSILEDSGYMARAAFIMDRLMTKLGLSGKAFVPLLMGFGCSVTAILSTRILKSKEEKKLSIFLIPFMSCSAKIPVYLVFLSAFFNENKTTMIFLIYIMGILFALLTSFLFQKFIKIKSESFIMELPDYTVPSPRNLYLHLKDQSKDFLENIGVIILSSSIVVWFLQSFDLGFRFTENNTESLLFHIGSFISPIFKFAGFGNWKASVSLISGLLSKEAIISTMSIVFGTSETSLSQAISANFSLASSISMVIFILLYSPCIASIATIKRELGIKFALFSFIYQTLLALIFSTIFYQILSRLI